MFSSKLLLTYLLSILLVSSATIVSVENADGSYSIGHQSQAQGQAGESIFSILSKASGWTGNVEDFENNLVQEPQQFNANPIPQNVETTPELKQGGFETAISVTKNIPYVEILRLLETFLRLKGEVASRVQNVLYDNSDLIKAVYNTFLKKIGTLHNFTLTGIVILRKILDFASTLFGQWSVNVGVNQNQYGPPHNDFSSFYN